MQYVYVHVYNMMVGEYVDKIVGALSVRVCYVYPLLCGVVHLLGKKNRNGHDTRDSAR